MSEHWIDQYNHHHSREDSHKKTDSSFDLFMHLSECKPAVDTNKAWLRVSRKIGESRSNWFYITRIAAVLIFVVGLGMIANIFYNYAYPDMVSIAWQESISRTPVELPDGSRVTLAEGAIISYPASDFEIQRFIKLKGEAYFEVNPGDLRFEVQTNHGNVQVLGTSFNVETNQELEVHVLEGSVMVANDISEVTITKGQKALTKSGVLSVAEISDYNTLAWRTGHFVFSNQKLKTVLPLLEEYYEVDIRTNKSLRNCKITAEFKELSLSEAMNLLATILNAKAQIEDNSVKLRGRGCE